MKLNISNTKTTMRVTVTLAPLNVYENNHIVVNTSDIEREIHNRGHDLKALRCIQNPIQLDNRRPDRCKGQWIYKKGVEATPTPTATTTNVTTTKKEQGQSVTKKQTAKKSRIKKQKY